MELRWKQISTETSRPWVQIPPRASFEPTTVGSNPIGDDSPWRDVAGIEGELSLRRVGPRLLAVSDYVKVNPKILDKYIRRSYEKYRPV